ncbi:MAG TPA: hypothetical protein VND93_34450, partial [Myxococcales bacterium]|nr:hypothetical protein [Myxococcales bacterium]
MLDAGTNAFNFYWRSTAASPPYSPSGSSVYLYGSANWMFAYSQNQTVNPGPPNKLGFGSTAQTVVAGACSAVTVARSLDVYGNYSPPTAALAVSLSTSSSGGRFYSDAACTTQITSVSIAAGALSANFYWKDTTPGSPTLTLSNTSPGLTAATQVETVLPKLVFTSAAQNLVAGQCSAPTTVQSQDGNAAGWNTSTSKTINLSTTSPAGPFFSDPACTVSISTVTMAAGTNAVTFYWKDTKAGSPTLTATATGYASGSQTQTIRPDVPALLNFTTAAQTVGAGLCSAVTTVEQEDTYGNAATQATSRSVSLLSTSATTRFYSDSACTAQITSVTIGASPATAASFYWKDAVAPQALTLTARSGGLLDGTQNETVSVGAATRLALTSAAKTVTAGACSGSATVGSQDASGNASNVGTATLVTLASSTGTTVFYAGGTCAGAPVTAVTIAAATSSATFSWVETTAGSLTLTPSATGFTGTGQAQTVTAGTGTKLNITTAAQSVPAGSCSAATTVAVEDSYGNAAPVGAAITVALTATSGTFGFYSDSSCTAVVTSVGIGAGSSSATFYWQDLSTGSVTITTSSSPLIADTQLESIGGRDQVAYRWYSSAGAALGAESTAVQIAPGTQVHLRVGIKAVTFAWKLSSGDAAPTGETFANAETHTGSYLSLAAADGSSETLVETRVGKGPTAYRALGDTGAAGYPFHVYAFSSLPSGKTTYPLCLTASTTGEALQVGYAFTSTPSLTPTFPAGWQLTSTTLTEVCFDLKAQGFNGGPLTVYLQDAIRGAGTDGTTDTFTLDRVAVKGDPPTYLALERASNSSFTGATQVLSAELWDDAAYANGAVVSPVLSGTSANEVRVESRPSLPASQVDVNPGGQGEWDFALAFPSGGGTQYYRMVVTDSLGTRLGALEVTTTPARADTAATKLAFTTAAFTVPAGACSGPLKVQAQDPAGNARLQTSARTVTLTSSATSGRFYSDASCTAQITSTTIAVGQSDAAFYWRDTAVGPSVVTAASAGLTSATQTENVNPGPPSAVAFTTASQNVTVGACSAAASVQVRDAYGNASPVGAATSGPLSSTSGTTRFYSDAACTAQITSLTVAAGLANASFYFLDTAAGSPTITYAPPGLTAASQVETFSVGLPTRLAITTAPLVVVAGQCSGAVLPGGSVVQAQDSFGNPANVTANITVALSSVSSTLVFYADAACAVAVTSRTITAPANTTTFYFRDTTASGTAVTATAAGLAAASQSETVSPAPPSALAISSAAQSVVAGACSAAVAVRTQDTYGNPSSVSSATSLPLTSSDAPVMRFYSDAACATPISSATVPVGLTSTQFFFKDTLAGGPVITVSGPGFSSATQAQTIRPAPTQGLAMSGFPSPSTAGVAGSFTLAAVDAYGNTAQDYAGSVQFSSSDARATLPPVTSFSPGTGLRTFSATLITAGTQSLTVVDNGVPPLSASQAGISVAAAAASALQPSGVPSPILPGTSHDVTVGAVDPFGNRATGYLGTVRFSSDDAAATLPANYAFTAGDQGRHTFTGGVKLQTVGTHQITVTDTVTGSVTGQQANIVVLQAQGGFCAGDGECSTGYCVGAVCCDTSCAGACNSCVLPGRVGTCSLVADGTSCTNGVYCDGAETCRTGTCTAGTPVACVDPSGYDQ